MDSSPTWPYSAKWTLWISAVDGLDRNVRFIQADLMNVPPALISSAESLSCLHALEHFGWAVMEIRSTRGH